MASPSAAGAAQTPAFAATARAPAAEAQDEDEEQGQQTAVFASYECKSISFGREHPGDIAEATGLALVPLPKPTYPLQDSIPSEIIENGKLSILQLEGVQYACQRHQQMLPDGTRAGFFIGDGAGVGKGRQISGIILNSWARGEAQHVWMSTSKDLREDAERDLRDLGVHIKVIDGCQELSAESSRAFGLSKELQQGVLFSTYSTLIGAGKKQSRLDQIVQWCGGDKFSGVLVFDEAHKAKNFHLGDKTDMSTKTSKCVIEIQRKMPLARVVYCSATGVTELSNLAYCERLGLWGEGLPFPSFEKFFQSVSKRGVFFLEMLSMELKRNGSYVSRGLSFVSAEFETLTCRLSEEQRGLYDEAAALWYEVMVALDAARAQTGAPKRLMSQYWGAHQRFFKQLIIACKVDFIVEQARSSLAAGNCVVIGLQGTGEAALNSWLARNPGASTFMSSARECLISFLVNHFPTKQSAADAEAQQAPLQPNDQSVHLGLDPPPHHNQGVHAGGGGDGGAQQGWGGGGALGAGKVAPPRVIKECEEARDMLIAKAEALDLPMSALDSLIDRLGGHTEVAEMTGRTSRLVRATNGREVVVQQRGKAEDEVDQVNVKECARFNSGQKLVAIISDAASTGISLHAGRTFKNQRRRVHMTLELPWSADKAVQQLGRTHRSNQVHAPTYKLIISDLAGEMRFASAVAKRLQSLGALTKGDRRAAVGQDMAEYDLDTSYGRISLGRMFESIAGGSGIANGGNAAELAGMLEDDGEFRAKLQQFDGLSAVNACMQEALTAIGCGTASGKEEGQANVKRFLGKLLGLRVRMQNALFHYFFSVMAHEVNTAKKEGRYSDAITDLFGGEGTKKELTGSEVVYTSHITGATCSVHSLNVDRGLSIDDAIARLEKHREGLGEGEGDRDGFYESKREVPGRKMKGWMLAMQRRDIPTAFVVGRPNTGMSRVDLDQDDLKEKYVKRTPEQAMPAWNKIYEESVEWDRGERVLDVHILSGSLVPLWNQVQLGVRKSLQKGTAGLTSRDVEMKVVRVEAGGESLVGIKLPFEAMKDVKEELRNHSDLQSGGAVRITTTALPPTAVSPYSTKIDATYMGKDTFLQARIEWDPYVPNAFEVTVTLPAPFDGQFRVSLPTLGQSLTVRLPSDAAREGGGEKGNIAVEPVAPVVPAALKRAMTAPKTMLSFFSSKAPVDEGSSGNSDSPGTKGVGSEGKRKVEERITLDDEREEAATMKKPRRDQDTHKQAQAPRGGGGKATPGKGKGKGGKLAHVPNQQSLFAAFGGGGQGGPKKEDKKQAMEQECVDLTAD